MIPITRKDHYLNEIVGWGDNAPEKPYIEEEFFFAEILGEAVQAPEPLTRYQMYLAKIAGRNIDIPYPKTRLEYFLAKAAGMDITVPVPITREEIYWSNYTAIVEFEVENVPPLTYKAIERTLKNYRIYGNTVNGENVGDLITEGEHAGEYKVAVTVEGKNLLQNTATSQTINGVTFTVNDDGSITCNGTAEQTIFLSINNYIRIEGNVILSGCPDGGGSDSYMLRINSSGTITTRDQGSGANAINPCGMVEIRIVSGYTCNNVTFYPMIRKADIEDDTYEPYQPPVTTPIYLPEQIKMVGDEAEYVDYKEQKQHRVRKNLFDYTIHSGNTDGYLWDNGTVETFNTAWRISDYIPCNGTVFTINPIGGNDPAICLYDENKQYIRGKNYNTGGAALKSAVTIESSTVASYIRFSYKLTGYDDQVDDLTKIMLNSGSEALPYEPYIADTELDVTLPTLPTLSGTNTLSVGTEVQPSKVYIKGEKERE